MEPCRRIQGDIRRPTSKCTAWPILEIVVVAVGLSRYPTRVHLTRKRPLNWKNTLPRRLDANQNYTKARQSPSKQIQIERIYRARLSGHGDTKFLLREYTSFDLDKVTDSPLRFDRSEG